MTAAAATFFHRVFSHHRDAHEVVSMVAHVEHMFHSFAHFTHVFGF